MNLRHALCTTILAISPMAALAGNLIEPQPIAQVTPPAPVMDWSGAYAGLSFGSYGGDASGQGISVSLDRSTNPQIFGGYQFQNGSFVYGAELALGVGGGLSDARISNVKLDKIYDLKARLGYAMDSVLLYGVVGYSTAQVDIDTAALNADFSVSGMNYGLGIDYAINENFVVGAEYLMRNLDASNALGSGRNLDGDLNSFSLRAAYKF